MKKKKKKKKIEEPISSMQKGYEASQEEVVKYHKSHKL